MATKHINHLIGKTGRIFVARKGSVMVFVLSDGETYLSNCMNPSNVLIANPVPAFWRNSVDWECGRAEYLAFGMDRDQDDSAIYPSAEPLFKAA